MFTADMARYLVVTFFISAFLLKGTDGNHSGNSGNGGDSSGNPTGNSPSGGGGGGGGGGSGGGSCGGGGKPEVAISFDSTNCPSMQFFAEQVKPAVKELSSCVTWDFIPCSTSKIVNDTLQCCGGVMACQINVLHACAAHFYEKDQVKLGNFFICMMTDANQYVKGEGCAKAAGMDWKVLDGCQPSKQAAGYCNNRYQKLNKLHEPNIPGVIFDKKYDAAAEASAMKCLKTEICNQIKKKGGNCPACGSSGGSGGGSGGSGGGSGGSGGGHGGSGGGSGGSGGGSGGSGGGSGGSGGGHGGSGGGSGGSGGGSGGSGGGNGGSGGN